MLQRFSDADRKASQNDTRSEIGGNREWVIWRLVQLSREPSHVSFLTTQRPT
jgi:hypothetical protein